MTRETLDILRKADRSWKTKSYRLVRKVWQSFAVLLPVRTVGVMGDERTYENATAIRVVESQDGMTADWVRLPGTAGTISNRIVNETKGVNRVVTNLFETSRYD